VVTGFPLSIGAGYLAYRVCTRVPWTGADLVPSAAGAFGVLAAIFGVFVYLSFSSIWTIWMTKPVSVTVTEVGCAPSGEDLLGPCTDWLSGFVTATEQGTGQVYLPCKLPDLPHEGDQVLMYVDTGGRRTTQYAACTSHFAFGEIVLAGWLAVGTGAVVARTRAAYDRRHDEETESH